MNLTESIVTGLSLGSIYALVALGIVILYKASEVLNLAHGSCAVLGAYVTARMSGQFGFLLAALAGIAAAALAALLIERLFVNRIRNAAVASLTIMTVGIEILIQTDLTRRIGSDIMQLGQPWGSSGVEILGSVVPWNRIITIAVTIVVIGAFVLAFRFTGWGVSMRAAAEDRETSELLGIRLSTVAIVSWGTAGALAGIAGILLTGAPTAGLEPAMSFVVLRAFAAALIGGLDSVTGALVGGLVVGMIEALTITFQSDLDFLGRGLSDVAAYLVMFLVLLVRPQGIFGQKVAERV